MKKTRGAAAALLAVCICLSFGGCGKGRDVSGIGTVKLNDKTEEGGVGTLGGSDNAPQDAPAPATPAPEPTPPEPTPEPTPARLATEVYEDDSIRMTIPQGWTVQYSAGENGMFYVKAYDAADASYYSAYQTYFILTPQARWETDYDTLKACLESLTAKSAGTAAAAPASGIQSFQ